MTATPTTNSGDEMRISRGIAVLASAAAVMTAAGYGAYLSLTDAQAPPRAVQSESLRVPDLSRDEYVAQAAQHLVHGTVISKTGQQRTDDNGDMEQQWLVEAERSFKGGVTGRITVNTNAFSESGEEIPDPGAPAIKVGGQYVFAGLWNEEDDRLEIYGGAAGIHASRGLGKPDPASRLRGLQAGVTVEQRWVQAVSDARPAPRDASASEN
ncbi:hypothetical protein OHA98_20550 [Streptomyces sp. NBC_00654]|uniref:hypothetical protein n=1 Tax=Streptomyces sp. NBC_00654 TaxID=2975799 RepID=UPI00225749BC|nr:hypothetical protein [Streptomyces sp. NBC_00654]MCX4967136.1 hypothetical protein [Streptomyces sp. NBC_00654]